MLSRHFLHQKKNANFLFKHKEAILLFLDGTMFCVIFPKILANGAVLVLERL